MYDPFQEMEDMMRRYSTPMSLSQQRTLVPAMDMYEENDNLVVETPLAGMNPKDVEITLEKGVLTIQGKTTKEHEVDEKNYYSKEIRSGSFYRQVALPTAVVEDDVEAEFQNGILKITAPKASPTKAKKVNVQIKGKK